MSKLSATCLGGLLLQLEEEGVEQHQRGERGRADRVPLGDGLGRVADRVERVGDVAHVLRQFRHLGDAARVVGDRAERVERDDQAGQRELRHHGDRDAVDAGELVGAEDREHEHQHRGRRGLEALGEALDDVGRVPGLRGLGDRPHRAEAGRRVVVGDHEQQRRDAEPDQAQSQRSVTLALASAAAEEASATPVRAAASSIIQSVIG